jgi:catalase-peroxidase
MGVGFRRFRGSDMRGGANGARIRLAPQKDWASMSQRNSRRCCRRSKASRADFNGRPLRKKVSLADLIVLAGACGGRAGGRRRAGQPVTVRFTPGRMDASQAQTDVDSFKALEPVADGFRNYQKARYAVPAEAC